MKRAIAHHPAGTWPPNATDSVTLDFDARHRRRTLLVTDGGDEVLLDLERAVAMADGDGLELDDGSWLLVTAALERIVEVWCNSPKQLARIAWHLGNRHIPTELHAASIRIRPDAVLERMIRDLGAEVGYVDRAFQPESGAYAHQRGQGHHHHDHDQGHHHHHADHDH